MKRLLFLIVSVILTYSFILIDYIPIMSGEVIDKEYVVAPNVKVFQFGKFYAPVDDKWLITLEANGVIFEVEVDKSEYKDAHIGEEYNIIHKPFTKSNFYVFWTVLLLILFLTYIVIVIL